jgi:dihydroorotase-like cyclic amidohydrolase
MKVRNYVNTLIEMLKNNPEIEDYEVIYSQDDEGNSYQKVNFTPTVVLTSDLGNSYVEIQSIINNPKEGNAICIN